MPICSISLYILIRIILKCASKDNIVHKTQKRKNGKSAENLTFRKPFAVICHRKVIAKIRREQVENFILNPYTVF